MNEWINQATTKMILACIQAGIVCVCVCLRECNAMEWNEFKKKIKSNQMRMNEWMKDIKILKFQIKKKKKKKFIFNEHRIFISLYRCNNNNNKKSKL